VIAVVQHLVSVAIMLGGRASFVIELCPTREFAHKTSWNTGWLIVKPVTRGTKGANALLQNFSPLWKNVLDTI